MGFLKTHPKNAQTFAVFEKKTLLYGAIISRYILRGFLEAARKKPNAVPQQKRSPLNISCDFCCFDKFNATEISSQNICSEKKCTRLIFVVIKRFPNKPIFKVEMEKVDIKLKINSSLTNSMCIKSEQLSWKHVRLESKRTTVF